MNEEKTYSEQILLQLIEKSLAKMNQLDELCEEMVDDPKSYVLWVQCVEKLSNVIEKLYKIQNPQTSNSKRDLNQVNINNAVMIGNSADFLMALEAKYDGIKTIEDAYLE